MDNDLYIFRKYKPDDNWLPEGLVDFGTPQVLANSVLRNRSIEEIASLLFDIDNYTHLMDPSNEPPQEILSGLDDPFLYDQHRRSLITLIKDMGQHKYPAHISTIPNLTWAECFAAVAAGKLAYASEHCDAMEKNEEFSEYESLFEIASYYLGPATEAGLIASLLGDTDTDTDKNSLWGAPFRNLLKSVTSSRSSTGGSKKALHQAGLKAKVLRLDQDKYKLLNARKSSIKIVDEELTEDDYWADRSRGRIIALGNEQTRIYEWIRKERNQSIEK